MDGFGFRWMKFLGLRFNSKKYCGDAKNGGGGGWWGRERRLGKFFLSLIFLKMLGEAW